MIDIKQLSYFVRVAEAGSFSRAATTIGIAQPALSRQVRQLETEINQTLLVRNGRGVTITQAGEKLLAHAIEILNQLERAKSDLEGFKGAPVGDVSIGMPATIAKLVTVPFVSEFRSRFPRARVRIVEGLSTYLKEFLLSGRIDIAILYNVPQSPVVNIIPLLREELFLISAKGMPDSGPVDVEQLANHPLIVPARPNAIRVLLEQQLFKVGKKLNIACEIDAISPTLELVAARHGSTVLAQNALRAWSTTGSLVARQIRPRLQTQISIVFSARGPMTLLQRSAGDLLKKTAHPLLTRA